DPELGGDVRLAVGAAAVVHAVELGGDLHLGVGRPVLLRPPVDLLVVQPAPRALHLGRGGDLERLLRRLAVLHRGVEPDADRHADTDHGVVDRVERRPHQGLGLDRGEAPGQLDRLVVVPHGLGGVGVLLAVADRRGYPPPLAVRGDRPLDLLACRVGQRHLGELALADRQLDAVGHTDAGGAVLRTRGDRGDRRPIRIRGGLAVLTSGAGGQQPYGRSRHGRVDHSAPCYHGYSPPHSGGAPQWTNPPDPIKNATARVVRRQQRVVDRFTTRNR